MGLTKSPNAIALIIFLCCSIVVGQSGNLKKERKERCEEFTLDYTRSGTEYFRVLDIGLVKAGETLDIVANLRNQANMAIQCKEVVVSCNCLDAKMTKDEVLPGETTPLRIKVSADKEPTQLDKKVTVTLKLVDETYVRLQFQMIYSHFAGFTHREFVHKVVLDDKPGLLKESFDIPLILSRDLDPAKIRIKKSSNLSFATFRLQQRGARWVSCL